MLAQNRVFVSPNYIHAALQARRSFSRLMLTPFTFHIIIFVKTVHTTTDAQLIHEAKRGNKAAFTSLVKRYEETVYRFSYKVCRDKEKAEEALQDTFISMYRSLDSFDGRSKLTTWLYRITANHCLMKRRRRKMDAMLESYDNPPVTDEETHRQNIPRWEETPADTLLKRELKDVLDKAILKLPVDYHVVFVLRDVEGNSNEETARILGISVEATKSRLRRARAFLRDQLNPYMTSEEE